MKNKLILLGLCGLLFLVGCEKKDSPFFISERSVGALTDSTLVKELERVFENDSIVKDSLNLSIGALNQKIEIYEKGGLHLMTLTPNQDSVPTIENVRIFDPRYQTKSGIGLSSTFMDIQKNYSIKKIVTTLNSVVLFPKESNLYFTIDKEQLPANLRYSTSNIEAVQIPDNAKIKYLMLGWE